MTHNEDVEEILIARVVGREDSPEDWQNLRQLARSRADLLPRLIDSLEDDCSLRSGMSPFLNAAESVELPIAAGPGRGRDRRWTQGLSGWLAALVLAMLWIGAREPEPVDVLSPVAGTGEPLPAAGSTIPVGDLGGDYMGELPRQILRSQAISDAEGIELVYVRRVVMRTKVPELYEMRVDDSGTPFSSTVRPADYRTRRVQSH